MADATAPRLLEGKVAIVTGSGRGIGRAHALELARHGATVIVNDPGVGVHGEGSDEDPAEATVADIEAAGGRAVVHRGSVVSWEDCRSVVELAGELGGLDILVNNAGIVRDRMITSMNEADFDDVIAVHLKGTFSMTKHACDHWRARAKAGETTTGRIINTTSGVGFFGNVGQAAYAAAKAAIASLTTVTALEMARYGVTVNAISPVALTRMTSTIPAMADAKLADGAFDPMDPANSSPVVAFLASDAAAWLSGQVLRIEGNVLRRMHGWRISDRVYQAKAGGRLEAEEVLAGTQSIWETIPGGLNTSAGVSLSVS
ncbi:MAG: short-chain dehydrogenase [Acidimicrobiales bacterium]|nr:short-chain dehydrogenase [Acidimicrobiales bacterium]